jgi:hypothetical protein
MVRKGNILTRSIFHTQIPIMIGQKDSFFEAVKSLVSKNPISQSGRRSKHIYTFRTE